MEKEIIVALITSIVAIVVASISGIFSYYSSKRIAKVEAMQPYLQFLQHKMEKLEEIWKALLSIKGIDSNDDIKRFSTGLVDRFHYNLNVMLYSSYLFTNKAKFHEIKDLGIAISNEYDSITIQVSQDGSATQLDKRDDSIPKESLAMDEFNRKVEALICEELESTFNELMNLSITKKTEAK